MVCMKVPKAKLKKPTQHQQLKKFKNQIKDTLHMKMIIQYIQKKLAFIKFHILCNIRIIIYCEQHEALHLSLSPKTPIATVKQLIASKWKICVSKQHILKKNGQEPHDHSTLNDIGAVDGETFTLTVL
jgi:hypothetical protein